MDYREEKLNILVNNATNDSWNADEDVLMPITLSQTEAILHIILIAQVITIFTII